MDNTVNDLRYEIKFENPVKDKINVLLRERFLFFKQKYIFLFLEFFFSFNF